MKELKNTVKCMGDVYRHIFYNNTSSRQMIASDLGISLPTVTQTLNILKDAELIYNAGEFESTGGRKANMLSIVADARVSVGVDITKSRVSFLLVDLKLHIMGCMTVPMQYEDTEAYYDKIAAQIELLLDTAEIERERLLGVGISLPAIINEDTNTIAYARVLKLPGDFYKKIQKKIRYPVKLFNDANSAGWAEIWSRGSKQKVVYLSLSDSVGGAFVSESLYTGNNWRGAEFGHMTIVPNGKKCYCGSVGCLDAYCNAKILSEFTDGDLERFFGQLKEGNQGFRTVFAEYIENLSVAVNNLRMCFDCDVVLGGSVGAYLEGYLEEVQRITGQRSTFEEAAAYIQVCSFRKEPAAAGAALYYIDQFVRSM